MPKPASSPVPYNYSQQQPRPVPYAAPSPQPKSTPIQAKPSGILYYKKYISCFVFQSLLGAANKPSFNVNVQGTPRSGNRVFMKGSKGSALLNRNENANQPAACYACGTTIRYIFF